MSFDSAIKGREEDVGKELLTPAPNVLFFDVSVHALRDLLGNPETQHLSFLTFHSEYILARIRVYPSTSISLAPVGEIVFMSTCIQNENPVTKAAKNPILTIRLNDAEQARFWRLMDAARERSAYAGKSDILRELLGLNPPSVLTTAEINFFRTGQKKPGMFHSQTGMLATEITLTKERKTKVK